MKVRVDSSAQSFDITGTSCRLITDLGQVVDSVTNLHIEGVDFSGGRPAVFTAYNIRESDTGNVLFERRECIAARFCRPALMRK